MKVYCISNNETGETIYVGRTCQSLEDYWVKYTTDVSSDVVKRYMISNGGYEKYSIELLNECKSMQDALDWESHLILDMEPICNMEEWKETIINGLNYEISSLGNVRLNGNAVKETLAKDGYRTIVYFNGWRLDSKKVHRLVATLFIPNPENKRCVDHINRIRNDNRVENLRWVTHQENSLNLSDREHSTPERNIYLVNGKYSVKIHRKNTEKFNKLCKSLEEAIRERDNYLKIYNTH